MHDRSHIRNIYHKKEPKKKIVCVIYIYIQPKIRTPDLYLVACESEREGHDRETVRACMRERMCNFDR